MDRGRSGRPRGAWPNWSRGRGGDPHRRGGQRARSGRVRGGQRRRHARRWSKRRWRRACRGSSMSPRCRRASRSCRTMARPSSRARRSSWPARSTGPWCARPRSMARATARCSSCSGSPRPGVVPLPPRGRMSAIHVDDLAAAAAGAGAGRRGREPPGCSSPTTASPAAGATTSFARAIGWALGRRVAAAAAARSSRCGWRRAATG